MLLPWSTHLMLICTSNKKISKKSKECRDASGRQSTHTSMVSITASTLLCHTTVPTEVAAVDVLAATYAGMVMCDNVGCCCNVSLRRLKKFSDSHVEY